MDKYKFYDHCAFDTLSLNALCVQVFSSRTWRPERSSASCQKQLYTLRVDSLGTYNLCDTLVHYVPTKYIGALYAYKIKYFYQNQTHPTLHHGISYAVKKFRKDSKWMAKLGMLTMVLPMVQQPKSFG